MIDIISQLWQTLVCLFVYYNTQTYSLMKKCKIVKSLNCLIERLGTYDTIMFISNIRKDWYVNLQIMMFAQGKFQSVFFISELYSVG